VALFSRNVCEELSRSDYGADYTEVARCGRTSRRIHHVLSRAHKVLFDFSFHPSIINRVDNYVWSAAACLRYSSLGAPNADYN
jgi:hypothetical protein